MDKYFKHIALAILAVTCGAFLFFTYRTYQSVSETPFGATLTNIATSTVLRDFPAIFNANMAALNTDKLDSYDVIGGEGVTWASTTFTVSFNCSEVEGTGIDCSGEDITLNATGDWTGTLDTVEGAAFLTENEFLATTTRVSNGGTGLTTLTANYLLMGNGTSNVQLTRSPQIDTLYDGSTGGGTLTLDIVNNASGVNYLGLQAGEAGTTVDITTLGSDDNVGLTINTKGTATTTISDNFAVTGSSSIGMVINGTWRGDAIADAYLSDTLTASNYLLNTSYYGTTTLPAKTATTTGVNGIDISGGCFAIGGTCLASGGSGTVNNGSEGQLAYYEANGTAVSGTSTLFITTDGKLGIGTTTPSGILMVNKTSPSANEVLFRVGTSDDINRFSIDEDGDVSFDSMITGASANINNYIGGAGGLTITGQTSLGQASSTNLTVSGTSYLAAIIGTGLADFGGATRFEIPNGAAVYTNAAGEIAIDTTSGQLRFSDGTATSTALVFDNWKPNIASSSSLLTSLTATSTIYIPVDFQAITITDIACYTDQGTSTITISDGTNATEFMACGSGFVAEDDGSIANASFTAKEKPQLNILYNYAGTPKQLMLTVRYRIDAD